MNGSEHGLYSIGTVCRFKTAIKYQKFIQKYSKTGVLNEWCL